MISKTLRWFVHNRTEGADRKSRSYVSTIHLSQGILQAGTVRLHEATQR